LGSQQVIVLDTHVLVWWVARAAGISVRGKRAIQSAARQGPLVASAISVFEITTAARRQRLRFNVSVERWLADVQSLPELRFEPVTPDIASGAGMLESTFPGDPADRIIAATAMILHAKLVTADHRLRGLKQLDTVW
jgi:PIN domain nuclease of toxin-antitoxin system